MEAARDSQAPVNAVAPGRRARRALIAGSGVALLVLLCADCPAGSSAPLGAGAGWNVTVSPFAIGLSGGKTRLADGDGISYSLADGSTHTLGALSGSAPAPGGTAYHLRSGDGHTASVVIRSIATGLRVAITVSPATDVTQLTETFAATPTEQFMGAGENPGLRGSSVATKVSYHCGEIAAPFFVSSRGYGMYIRSDRIGAIGFPDAGQQACADPGDAPCRLTPGGNRLQICLKGNTLVYDIYFGTPRKIVRLHAIAAGKPRLPPLSQLGLIKWRDLGDAQTVLTDVDEFHALGIPIGWELIDNPWEAADCLGRLQFGTPRFPDGTATIGALHARGVKVMLWISPLVSTGEACQPPPYDPTTLIGPTSRDQDIDLLNPAARARFVSRVAALFTLGVDGLKVDRGDDVDLEPRGPTLSSRYPVLLQQAVLDAARSAGLSSFGEMVRAASSASTHLVAGVWAGDQDASWQSLGNAVGEAQSAGVSGFPIWGSDIGGYSSAGLTDELFVRWAQFGALCPIMEVGGQGPNATPWTFAPATVDLFRRAVLLHYELAPYLRVLERQAAATGDPILRPLGYAYPNDKGSWVSSSELMVGDDLLADPIVGGGFGSPQPLQIGTYLPPGRWYDLFTGGPPIAGPAGVLRLTTLADFPLYARAGAVLPFDLRLDGVWRRPWTVNSVSTSGRAGWLYAPAPGTVQLTVPGRGTLSAGTRGDVATIRVTNAARETQIFIPAAATSVTIAGRTLARRPVTALAASSDGWATATTPFPGTIVKLDTARRTTRIAVRLRQ
jgi:alpha-D-xyloside xylohydrolase